ncbi:MAG: tetratricopeptide repeat protein [Brumimicrobium sp.]
MKNSKIHITFALITFLLNVDFGISQDFSYANLAEDKPDSVRLKAYTEIAESFIETNKDSALYYIEEGVKLCDQFEKVNQLSKENPDLYYRCGKHFMVKGYFYYRNKKPNEALRGFKRAEKIFHKLKNNKYEAECLNNSAVILTSLSNNAEAIIDYHKALNLYRKLNDSIGSAYTLNNLSRIYRDQDDIGQAIKLIEESLELSKAKDAEMVEALALNGYAGLQKIIGDTTKALRLYEKSLSLRKSLNDRAGMASVLNNIGSLYKQQRKYEEALDHFQRSREIAEEVNNKIGIGHTLYNQGEVYFQLSDLYRAEQRGKEALKIGEETENVTLLSRSAELLMNVYKLSNKWKSAFKMQTLKMEMDSKMINAETKQVAQREALKYEFEKQRAIDRKEEEQVIKLQNERAERQKVIYLAIGIVTLLLIALLFFVIQRLRTAKQQNRLITKQSNERKMMLQEIHHRVKNNFQIVSSLLRLQSYSIENETLRQSFEEAVSRINSMSIVHDIIYRQKTFSDIDSKEYLEKLVENLKRSSGNPKIAIEIDAQKPKLKIETLIHLGIALNELIINSFKYAFTEEQNDPKIRIFLTEIGENEYRLLYQDNGIGINKEIDKSSFGMELIQTLIEHLEGSVSIDSESPWNTTITIKFKDV